MKKDPATQWTGLLYYCAKITPRKYTSNRPLLNPPCASVRTSHLLRGPVR